MTEPTPARSMAAATAAEALKAALGTPKKPLTIADAATASGLPLRDAESGLHHLVAEYRGHLRVGESGDLLFVFPTGFTKPWVVVDGVTRFFARAGQVLGGLARFVVRAWLTVVLLGYVALFLAVIIAFTIARSSGNSSSDRDEGVGFSAIGVVLRIVSEAFFWTFHPFSPFAYGSYGYGAHDERVSWGTSGAGVAAARPRSTKKAEAEVSFYEKVNRFFFGVTPPPVNPWANERKILATIRAGKGRIGLADVMRVTGLPRDEADPLMARLMVDYEGDVSVHEGGILYTFSALRRTADETVPDRGPPPVWTKLPELPPFTGNGDGTNFLIVLLNGFNLVMSGVALENGLSLNKLVMMFEGVKPRLLPQGELAIALGVVPLVFSLVLFAIPLGRALLRGRAKKKLARERGRLAVMREVLTRIEQKQPVTDAVARNAYRKAAGEEPGDKQLTRELVRLGGDVEILAEGKTRYRFANLETEAAAVEAEREAAPDSERKVGKIVFRSDE